MRGGVAPPGAGSRGRMRLAARLRHGTEGDAPPRLLGQPAGDLQLDPGVGVAGSHGREGSLSAGHGSGLGIGPAHARPRAVRPRHAGRGQAGQGPGGRQTSPGEAELQRLLLLLAVVARRRRRRPRRLRRRLRGEVRHAGDVAAVPAARRGGGRQRRQRRHPRHVRPHLAHGVREVVFGERGGGVGGEEAPVPLERRERAGRQPAQAGPAAKATHAGQAQAGRAAVGAGRDARPV